MATETQANTSRNQTNGQQPGDSETQALLTLLLEEQEKVRAKRVPNVRTVLVVLSSRAMVYDVEALRQKVVLAYPGAAVFFRTTKGRPVGATCPPHVDLLIDLTGPRQRQNWFYALGLRRMARVAVGRNAGLFRKRVYDPDRIFDEKSPAIAKQLPEDLLARERFVQRQVLALAGVPLAQHGDATPDLGKSIALALPPLRGN